jgi:hypothetical protein
LCKKKFLVSRNLFCQQIPSADFCRQQIFFLSADSISKFFVVKKFVFLSANVFADVMEIALTPAYTVSRQACFLLEKFSPSVGAQFRFYDDSIRFAGPSWKVRPCTRNREKVENHAILRGENCFHTESW